MTPASLEGQTLGKYHILEPVGRGGMAQVYRAYHPQLDRYVAIKVLRSDLVEDKEFLARFQREAKSVAALRHPNIVQVFDADVQDDHYYMVMELLEGDTLKANLSNYRERGEFMPTDEMVRILCDVLKGLAYAHGEGIIHRDMKPANILLTRRGEAVITDFGIAQIVGGTSYTVTGALMGTLHYMPPEQGLGGKVDKRSDLYSLGVVVYEILTGHPPFEADTPLAILLKHLNDPLPLPHKPDRTIPEPFERVVLKALAKQPDDRFQTAEEMAQALQNAAAQMATAGEEINSQPGEIKPTPVNPAKVEAAQPANEPAVVYSGTARKQIADVDFAADDTDLNLGQRLQESNPQGEAAEPAAGGFSKAATELATAVGGVMAVALTKAAAEVRKNAPGLVTAPAPEVAGANASEHDHQHAHHVALAAVVPGVVLILVNLLGVGVGSTTGIWAFFKYGWPAELLMVALLLSSLMEALSLIWMFIPAGILLGNGILLGYYAITGFWWQWALLWPLEPVLVLGVIYSTIILAHRANHSQRFAHRLGIMMMVVSGFMIAVIGWFSLVAEIVHRIIH